MPNHEAVSSAARRTEVPTGPNDQAAHAPAEETIARFLKQRCTKRGRRSYRRRASSRRLRGSEHFFDVHDPLVSKITGVGHAGTLTRTLHPRYSDLLCCGRHLTRAVLARQRTCHSKKIADDAYVFTVAAATLAFSDDECICSSRSIPDLAPGIADRSNRFEKTIRLINTHHHGDPHGGNGFLSR